MTSERSGDIYLALTRIVIFKITMREKKRNEFLGPLLVSTGLPPRPVQAPPLRPGSFCLFAWPPLTVRVAWSPPSGTSSLSDRWITSIRGHFGVLRCTPLDAGGGGGGGGGRGALFAIRNTRTCSQELEPSVTPVTTRWPLRARLQGALLSPPALRSRKVFGYPGR